MFGTDLKTTTITLIIGLAIGYFLLPHKTKVETKEVVKTVIQQQVQVKDNVVTHTVYVKAKDGTETTTTDTTDKTEADTVTKVDTVTIKEKIITSNGVSVGIFAINQIQLTKPDYGVLLDIPLASKASVFFTGDTTKRLGVGIRLQF